MSTVLVTGGSGVLGTHVVRLLRERGDEVRVLSRSAARGTHVGNLASGEGVAEATAGAEVIVHLATDPPTGRGDLRQTETLLQAAGDTRHLLYTAIVGIEHIPLGYYIQKLACERAIEASGVPATILRATQFHELLEQQLARVERLPVAALPKAFRFQPIAAAEVAERVAALAGGEPLGRAPELGGPEVLTLGEIAAVRGRPRRVVNLPLPGKIARGFREGRNTCPDHADGRQRWSEFVTSR